MNHPSEADGLLRRARVARRLGVRAAADLVGVSASRFSRVERAEVDGSLRLETLRRFAAALGYRVRLELVPEVDSADDLPVLAADAFGGDAVTRTASAEGPEAVLSRLRAEGLLRPATADFSELPPPLPMSDALRAALGGRTLTEVILAEREADPW